MPASLCRRVAGEDVAAIYTDDRLALVDAIEGRDGAKVGAIDEPLAQGKVTAIASPAPVRTTGITIG